MFDYILCTCQIKVLFCSDIIYKMLYMLQLDSLTQQELASRLTLNCMNCYVEPQKLQGVEVTIMDVSNTTAKY